MKRVAVLAVAGLVVAGDEHVGSPKPASTFAGTELYPEWVRLCLLRRSHRLPADQLVRAEIHDDAALVAFGLVLGVVKPDGGVHPVWVDRGYFQELTAHGRRRQRWGTAAAQMALLIERTDGETEVVAGVAKEAGEAARAGASGLAALPQAPRSVTTAAQPSIEMNLLMARPSVLTGITPPLQ